VLHPLGILAEANWYDEGNTSINNPILTDTCDLIRKSTNNPSALCSISGPEWGRDARELIGTTPSRPNNDNILIRVHPYASNIGNFGFFDWCNQLRNAGYLVYVGEFSGLQDDFSYDKKMIDFLEQNGISYSIWAIDKKSDAPRMFYSKFGFSDTGRYLLQKWAQKKNSN
jgi:hypothetical protein